ncbi:MAG: hypothetical protein WA802_10030, partial [Terracidiphilus sp.]
MHCWIALIFLAVAAVISFSKLPEVWELYRDSKGVGGERRSFREFLWCRNFVKGAVAHFFYVGARVSAASFVIRPVEQVTLNQAWLVSVG